ncbi:MAG: helix-turn-helix domain-containing protein [Microthrixaceae bacterium]
MDVAEVISRARGSSEVSVRALAASAGVAGSTITRIQGGVVDPTLHTVERILEAAGFELRLSVVRLGGKRSPRLGDLSDAWSIRRGRTRPDWTRWRALLDHLALHPELVVEAIYVPPLPSGSRMIDALLAGVADKIADDAGLPRPSWTSRVPALDEPYEPPARPGAQLEVPQQLAERGLMIDTESLWRDRRTVGV